MKTRVALGAIIVLVSAVLPLFAAENATQVTNLELYPNFETLSVYAYYSGDANLDNNASLEYRRTGGQWRKGAPLTRIYDKEWTGSIFHLRPATAYEVRVTFTDPDGVSGEVLTGTVTTRDDKWPVGAGKTIYVAPGGTGDGSKASPLGTIQAAVDQAQPGDTVLVAPGVYRESLIVRKSGKPDAYICIKGEPGAVLDGSDAGFLDREGPYRWRMATINGKRSYDNYVADCDWHVDYLAMDGRKLYGYDSLENMLLCRSGPPGGWYQDSKNSKLYVHVTKAYCSPNHTKTVVSRLSTGILLDGCRYVVVDGLEVRYFGIFGIDVKGSDNVIQNCLIHHHNMGININDKKVNNTTIQDCEVFQTSVWRWPWRLTKATRYEVDNIGARAGRGTVIRRNTVHGSFDGIGLSVWDTLNEPGWIQDTDINDNHIYNCGDDGCEPEGTCTNLRFWNNRIHDCLMVQSLAPITVGPAYLVNETYWNPRLSVLKIKVRTSGVIYLYNCTFHAGGYRQSVWDYGGKWYNLHFLNCVFYGTDYVFSDNGPSKEGTVTFDYDLLFTTNPGRFVKWENKKYNNLQEFQKAGYERHGISADPMFTAPEKGDFRPLAGSPLIDAGVHIPGINDDYDGAAPDIGSQEYHK